MRSSHRPRPKRAHDVVACSWPRCLSWPQPAAPGTPLGPLMPIGQQHTQHVAEARSTLARGALMASSRRCTIVHATRGLPRRQGRCGNAKLQPAWPEFFFSARARRKLYIDLCMERTTARRTARRYARSRRRRTSSSRPWRIPSRRRLVFLYSLRRSPASPTGTSTLV